MELPVGVGIALIGVDLAAPMSDKTVVHIKIGTKLAEAERVLIQATINHCRGNRSAAAKILGVGRATVYRKIVEENGDP